MHNKDYYFTILPKPKIREKNGTTLLKLNLYLQLVWLLIFFEISILEEQIFRIKLCSQLQASQQIESPSDYFHKQNPPSFFLCPVLDTWFSFTLLQVQSLGKESTIQQNDKETYSYNLESFISPCSLLTKFDENQLHGLFKEPVATERKVISLFSLFSNWRYHECSTIILKMSVLVQNFKIHTLFFPVCQQVVSLDYLIYHLCIKFKSTSNFLVLSICAVPIKYQK